jgi:hypothetical protein
MFVMERVSSSFHSGLMVLYLILDFTFCTSQGKKWQVKQIGFVDLCRYDSS